jgi:hypothetical protein
MCRMLPEADGTLATLYTAEDLDFFRKLAAVAEGEPLNLWLSFADFLSPDEPYFSVGNVEGSAFAGAWLSDPDTVGNETASCGYLDSAAMAIRRAPCSSKFAFVCMTPSEWRLMHALSCWGMRVADKEGRARMPRAAAAACSRLQQQYPRAYSCRWLSCVRA